MAASCVAIMANAEDIMIHGDFVQFNGSARCEGCQAKDLKCALQKCDDVCMACAGASKDCIFSRVVIVSRPKSQFQWEDLLKKSDKSAPIAMQTPAPSSITATTTPIVENLPNGQPTISHMAKSNDVQVQHKPRQDAEGASQRRPIRLSTPSDTEESHSRSGIDPTRRKHLGEVLNFADQEWEHKLAQNSVRVHDWLIRASFGPGHLAEGDHKESPSHLAGGGGGGNGADDESLESEEASEINGMDSPPAAPSTLIGTKNVADTRDMMAHPWIDDLRISSGEGKSSQPSTSNEAMVRYNQRAIDAETASRCSTFGERDESGFIEQDTLDYVVHAKQSPRLAKRPTFPTMTRPPDPPSNSNSTLLSKQPVGRTSAHSTLDRIISPSPWKSQNQSKDLYSQIPIMRAQTKIEPMPNIPLSGMQQRYHHISPKSRSTTARNPSKAKSETPARPVLAGDLADYDYPFEDEIKGDCPQIADYLLKRMSQEQSRRFKRLISFKIEHLKAVQHGRCPSGLLCLKDQNYDGRPETIRIKGFKPVRSEDGEKSTEYGEYSTDSKWMSSEYPMPPTETLPSEFECPLCFQVKKCQKPSDWAKHVCEDLQPFICTFEECNEPKSFKRKADWIRHENERHRQLERWVCNLNDCTHICYRKDNFVQHLVREHKLPEPKPRVPALRSTTIELTDKDDPVWRLVEESRQELPKSPKDEPCRFCGYVCSSWKKLSGHLAKHMEDIAFPIWKKVIQRPIIPEPNTSPLASATPPQPITLKPATYTPWYPQPSATSDKHSDISEQYQGSSIPQPNGRAMSTTSTPSIFRVNSKDVVHDPPPRTYLCDISGCNHERGFATHTDLKRHQKGVHGIYDEGANDSSVYRCQGKDCKDADKTWPRRDNFRGHLARKHPDEDIEELTERYVRHVSLHSRIKLTYPQVDRPPEEYFPRKLPNPAARRARAPITPPDRCISKPTEYFLARLCALTGTGEEQVLIFANIEFDILEVGFKSLDLLVCFYDHLISPF